MEIKYAVLSETGKVRAHNEDNFGIAENTPNGNIYIVCDGMGGHVGGAIASKLAVDSMLEYFKKEKYDNLILEIDKSFQFANEQIYARTLVEPELRGMGTTAVILIIKKDECYIGHVGDSRIYIKSEKTLYRLTKDHSFVQGLVDSGVISDEDAEKHPQKNQILKALGHTSEVKGTICKKPFRVKTGDTFLLCSDGLNGMINDATIEAMINNNDLEKSKNDLFEGAMENGGLDNVTVLLVHIKDSKFLGSNDFKSFNPTKKNRDQEDGFEKTIGFNNKEQFEQVQKPLKKKKAPVLYLLLGAVAMASLALSLFFIFRIKENRGPAKKTTNEQPPKNQDQALTLSDLTDKSFEELSKLASESVLVEESISSGHEIIVDGKKITLIIQNKRLVDIKKINQESPKPVKNEEAKPQRPTSSTIQSTAVQNQPCKLKGDMSNQLESIGNGEFYIEIASTGESLQDLISRIKTHSDYGCELLSEIQDRESLAKLNLQKNTRISKSVKVLIEEEKKLPKGTKILVKCKCDK
jgi:serine/threonine protein phosphatase PrpC